MGCLNGDHRRAAGAWLASDVVAHFASRRKRTCVQQDVDRDASGIDINAIPITDVERIGGLRDGVAAQYGSNAIARVISIARSRNNATRLGQALAGAVRYLD